MKASRHYTIPSLRHVSFRIQACAVQEDMMLLTEEMLQHLGAPWSGPFKRLSATPALEDALGMQRGKLSCTDSTKGCALRYVPLK